MILCIHAYIKYKCIHISYMFITYAYMYIFSQKLETLRNVYILFSFLLFRLVFTCPVGHVIENPNTYNEQQNPIPLEQVLSWSENIIHHTRCLLVSGACRGVFFGSGITPYLTAPGVTPDLSVPPKILAAPPYHIPIYMYICIYHILSILSYLVECLQLYLLNFSHRVGSICVQKGFHGSLFEIYIPCLFPSLGPISCDGHNNSIFPHRNVLLILQKKYSSDKLYFKL